MSLPDPAAPLPKHPPVVVALHWLSLATVVAAVLAVLLREAVEAERLRALLLTLHRQAGLLLLPLLAARLFARWRHGGPQATPGWRWADRAAQAAHALLYLGMAMVPLLGWALSDARGQHPLLLGLLPLPAFGSADPDLAETLEDRHLWAAIGGGAVLALHVAAALWHHWVLRDAVLRSMLPLRRSPSSAQG